MTSMIRKLGWSACLLFLASFAAEARAEFLASLSVSVSDAGGGLTLYEYLLTVDSASDQSVAILGVGIAADADPSQIAGPADWESLYIPGDTAIAWLSLDPSFDLAPGQSAVFSFLSALAPGPQDYLIVGGDFGAIDGVIAAPSTATSAVPEPSAWSLLGVGSLVGLLGSWHRRAGAGRP